MGLRLISSFNNWICLSLKIGPIYFRTKLTRRSSFSQRPARNCLMLTNFTQFLRSYNLHEVLLEMAVIWVCVFMVFRTLQGTRGFGVVKGVTVLLVALTGTIWLLGGLGDGFGRIIHIYRGWFMPLLAVMLIVVFQPELRQAMIRLGQTRLFRTSRSEMSRVVSAVSDAVQFLSKSQFGALIAIPRRVRLGGLVEGGQALDAQVSARLLQAIFWPNSPLHDLGVVIRGDRIVAASVQFPLIEDGSLGVDFGSRHRAAAGISADSDCIVVIVSEETGAVSIAEAGKIDYDIPREHFEKLLAQRLEVEEPSHTKKQPASEPAKPSTLEEKQAA